MRELPIHITHVKCTRKEDGVELLIPKSYMTVQREAGDTKVYDAYQFGEFTPVESFEYFVEKLTGPLSLPPLSDQTSPAPQEWEFQSGVANPSGEVPQGKAPEHHG